MIKYLRDLQKLPEFPVNAKVPVHTIKLNDPQERLKRIIRGAKKREGKNA